VRTIGAGFAHSLVLDWDGRVYSCGKNDDGLLGQGRKMPRSAPTLIEGLEGVRGIAAVEARSLVVAQSRHVFSWGRTCLSGATSSVFRPTIVNGFEGVRVRRVCADRLSSFAIGEAEELFSWELGEKGLLGHGDMKNRRSPKRVEALRGVRVSSVAAVLACARTDGGRTCVRTG
jgi:E3 ubiquitin-protein ligase HERC2